MKKFSVILKEKRDYYGRTEAAIEFAAQEYAEEYHKFHSNPPTHQELLFDRNITLLKANNLIYEYIFDDLWADVFIKYLNGKPIVSDRISKYDTHKWLDENVNQAICISQKK